MSGHSKWANIKHRKAAQDARKANVFTKIAKDITIAARDGGGDPDSNFRLRLVMDKARAVNMPNENIIRAIKRGTGELKDSAAIEEVMYEAYGPGQIALLIKAVTDNKNRTLQEVRNVLNKNGGKMVEGGGVAWQFEQVGNMLVSADGFSADEADEVETAIIESGAKDYRRGENSFLVFTAAKELREVKEALEKGGFTVREPGLIYISKTPASMDENTRIDYEKLLTALDENDDVTEVYDNIHSRS